MQLTAVYRGGDDPFEGDRVVPFRGLPVGAVVRRAALTITPAGADPAPPRLPFEEVFAFGPARDGELAAAEWGVTALTTAADVEVDLHARRTLSYVSGAHLTGSALTVDVGGLFVELNSRGAVRAPGDTAFTVQATGALPGVTVPRFRLTGTAAAPPSVDTVSVRSVPANVSLRLGTLGPFWAYVGELAAPERTLDFADTLQAFLLQADVENGVSVVPFGVHADGVARLDLTLELEYVLERSLLPAGLPEVTLPFDLSTFARTPNGPLSVMLPAGAQVVPGATAARVRGAFESTRIASGAGTGDEPPTAEAVVTAERAAAQPVEASGDVALTGLDLFLAPLSATARLAVTLLGDSDGKPFGDPLLPAPLEARLSREESRAAQWVTVPLAEEFSVEGGRRYWLVLQALAGEASWQASAAPPGAAPLQASSDAGLSWSTATDAHAAGPLVAFHRLRVNPAGFRMPLSIEVGSGPATQRVSLRRFEPLGRVDLTIDTPELANAFEAAAASGGPGTCPTAEHIVNGELDQWIGIGDELQPGGFIPLVGSPRALALPDGARAYVAGFAAGTGELAVSRPLLEPVELACAAAGAPIELDPGQLPIEPVFVAVDEGAGRAYVVGELDGEARLLIADLDAAARVGEPVPLDPFTGFALAPDGDRLLLLRRSGQRAVIEALDVRTAERLAREGGGGVSAAVTPVAAAPLQAGELIAGELPAPFAAAAAADGTLLAFALDGHTVGARLCLIGGDETPRFVAIGRDPVAVALTRDGGRIVVACAGDDTLRVVSGDAVEAGGRSIALAATPVAVTLAGDGRRAAVLSETDVALYDLDARRRLSSTPVSAGPAALAGSPGLDVLLVAESEGGGVARYAVPAVPLEWTLTSGAVEPRCFAGDLAALLGRRSPRGGGGRAAPVRREASAISQVVPVSGGCRYELSFRALADQSESVGEVLWRAEDCGLARADSVAIVELEPSAKDRAAAEPALVLHRAVLAAPPGAREAEVRFTVPPGGLAAVGFVSLKGSNAAGVNADLQQRQNGRAVGWDPDPEGGALSLRPSGAAEVAVTNEGADAGALVQRVAVTAGRTLVVELVGRATAAGADPGPRLAVHVLAEDGAPAGDSVIVPLAPQSFDRVRLAAEIPAGAVRAEVRLELPAGAGVALERITVRQEDDVEVPLVFRAEAPGELAVAAAKVAYDSREVPAPSVPASGLCAPTAPGDEPGAEPRPACGCCGSHEAADEVRAVVTPAGRPTALRRCAHCGCSTVSASGPHVRGAPTLAPSRPLGHARGAGLPVEARAAVTTLTDVAGIGPVRARRLARVGIATVDRLASADPRVVAAVLRTVSPRTATRMIESARHLSVEHSP